MQLLCSLFKKKKVDDGDSAALQTVLSSVMSAMCQNNILM